MRGIHGKLNSDFKLLLRHQQCVVLFVGMENRYCHHTNLEEGKMGTKPKGNKKRPAIFQERPDRLHQISLYLGPHQWSVNRVERDALGNSDTGSAETHAMSHSPRSEPLTHDSVAHPWLTAAIKLYSTRASWQKAWMMSRGETKIKIYSLFFKWIKAGSLIRRKREGAKLETEWEGKEGKTFSSPTSRQ